jgi:predicted ABC-type ATPase
MTLDVFMIGGANGAGKTTAAIELLPKYMNVFEFVNADEIAHGLNPIKPETANMMAGRMMIERIEDLINARKNFAFETTCAGIYHKRTLQKCHDAGYCLRLIFLWLPSADMAIKRVASRIQQGGHPVGEDTIRRRYMKGLKNLVDIWLPIAQKALILNSSGETIGSYPVIAEKTENKFHIADQFAWQQIESSAKIVK